MGHLRLLSSWPPRRWAMAGITALITLLALGLPTAVITNPWFGRATEPEWWAAPTLIITAALCGLLGATYVARATDHRERPGRDRSTAGAGAILGFFAIGCPVCNKLVLAAFGTTGALNWFQPAQLPLAVLSITVVGWALLRRLEGERACPRPVKHAIRP